MSTREDVSKFKFVQQVNPASVTATVTPADGAGVDTKGYESAAFLINVGAVAELASSPLGGGSWTFKAQEADADLNASYSDITESARIKPGVGVSAPNSSTGVFLTLDAAAHQNKCYAVGIISAKRYVRLVATAVSTPGASLLGWSAMLGRGMTPVS